MSNPRPKFLDSPRFSSMLKFGSAAHVALFQLSGGRLGRRFRGGAPVCLFTTIGRKSGRPRTKPLLYLADGERIVVVASQGGLPRHPAWYHNLVAHPEVTVELGRDRFDAVARVTSGEERERLWQLFPFPEHQDKTSRLIPVVALERRPS